MTAPTGCPCDTCRECAAFGCTVIHKASRPTRPMLDEAGYAWEEPALPSPLPTFKAPLVAHGPLPDLEPFDECGCGLWVCAECRPPRTPEQRAADEARGKQLEKDMRRIQRSLARQRAHDAGIVGRGEG